MFELRYGGKLSFFLHFSSAKLAAHFHRKTTSSATHGINFLFTLNKKSCHKHWPWEKSFAGTSSEPAFPSNTPLRTIKSLSPFYKVYLPFTLCSYVKPLCNLTIHWYSVLKAVHFISNQLPSKDLILRVFHKRYTNQPILIYWMFPEYINIQKEDAC